ncbi:MAG: PAS domain S-box protein [Desulfobacterales bacterium]|nr:PAS domain S-box protein [Desulfobacterales bacterium]
MIFSKNYSEILLATRLKLFNLMMLISFALISAIIMYSLYNVEKMVTGSMQHHLKQIIRNSQMTRELSKTFADIRLLAHLFYGKDDYLAIEGKNVLSQLQEIQPKITDMKAAESFQNLQRQFKTFLDDCSGLNKIFAESKAVNQEILSDLDWFDNTVTEFIIKLTIEGKDISEMETLSGMVSYREKILRIGKACEQHEKEALNNVSDNNESWILKNLNTMDLQTQYFVNYKDPVFAYIGKKLQKNITAYRNIILGLSRKIRKHDIMVSDLENSIVQYQTVMDNSDKRNVDESDSIRRNVKEMIDNSRLTILIIPLLILIGLSYITNMLIRFHIRNPMDMILKGIEAFHTRNFKSRIQMGRKDEWDKIENAFNNMADELINSYSALHASEKNYRGIFENAPLGIFQCTFNGDFMNVNPEMASILGYQNSEDLLNTWKNKNLWQLSVLSEDIKNIYKEINEKGSVSTYPMQITRKNNDQVWVILNARKIPGENSETAYIDGMITDITDRKLAQDALNQLRNYLNNIIDSMPSLLLGIDSDRRITQWNKEAEKVTGVSKEAALGQRFTDVLPQLNHETERIDLATRNQQVQKNSKVNMTFNEKTDFFDITTYPLTDDGIGSAVIRLDNVTEQVQMEKMLIQSEKMLSIGRLSAGIAHDFNNILTGIIGYTDLIRFFDLPKDSPAYPHLEAILISANRARDLVQQILTFSRRAKQKKVFLSLDMIVTEAVKLIRASLPSTIKIDQNIEKTNSTVLADPTQMHQVIMNLCTNAAYAMKEDGGILEITLSKETVHEEREEKDIQLPAPGDYICLTVSDTGQGIPPEIIGQIYDPFFTTKRQGEGTGMGLSVVHGIVEAHNGVIKADSQPGKGSRFRVYLPAFEKNAKLETREDMTTLPKGNERIIFADDEKHIVIFAEQVFKNLGYTFTGFTDSKKALEAFKRTPHWFDILITDLTMPEMTGTRLAREIYQIRPDIPIILCSGSADIDTEKDIESYCRFIRKPLSARLLAQSARKALTSSE